jgi:hypothetical protein
MQLSDVRNSASNEIFHFIEVPGIMRHTNPALFWILGFTVVTIIAIYLPE